MDPLHPRPRRCSSWAIPTQPLKATSTGKTPVRQQLDLVVTDAAFEADPQTLGCVWQEKLKTLPLNIWPAVMVEHGLRSGSRGGLRVTLVRVWVFQVLSCFYVWNQEIGHFDPSQNPEALPGARTVQRASSSWTAAPGLHTVRSIFATSFPCLFGCLVLIFWVFLCFSIVFVQAGRGFSRVCCVTTWGSSPVATLHLGAEKPISSQFVISLHGIRVAMKLCNCFVCSAGFA